MPLDNKVFRHVRQPRRKHFARDTDVRAQRTHTANK